MLIINVFSFSRKLSWMRKLFLKHCHLLTLMTSPSSGPGKARRWRVYQITSSLWTKCRGIIAMGSTLVKYPRTSSSASKCTTAWEVSVSIDNAACVKYVFYNYNYRVFINYSTMCQRLQDTHVYVPSHICFDNSCTLSTCTLYIAFSLHRITKPRSPFVQVRPQLQVVT